MIKNLFMGGGLIAIVLLAFCIAPSIFLWSVNSLAELGGISFYIPHTIWSYFVSLMFLLLFNARG